MLTHLFEDNICSFWIDLGPFFDFHSILTFLESGSGLKVILGPARSIPCFQFLMLSILDTFRFNFDTCWIFGFCSCLYLRPILSKNLILAPIRPNISQANPSQVRITRPSQATGHKASRASQPGFSLSSMVHKGQNLHSGEANRR